MKAFPMFIRTTGRRVVIAGGGEQAAQKARLILKTDAQITICAPELEPELADLAATGAAQWYAGEISPDTFSCAAMGFIATGCPAVDACLHGLAQAANCPVNVVDRPDLCDLTTPSLVDRDPVVVAIGTEGTAPVLARQIKTQVEEMLAPNLGGLAALAGRLRGAAASRVSAAKRRSLWRWVFAGAPRLAWTRGAERAAAELIKSAIADGGAPEDRVQGSVSLVGAGPGSRDLLTLRAVARLQEADVIFYDRLVDVDVLELARRDAERVFVGKTVGGHDWPQDRIDAVVLAEALKGRNVVRLKSGDPSVFGRAGEELASAREAGIPVEIVPGITAASAAAAALGRPLTERGVCDTLVLTTGRAAEGSALPDSTRHSGPGTTTAFYMATGQADRLANDLMSNGLPPAAHVTVAVDVSKPSERLLECPVAKLPDLVAREAIQGCAVVMVVWPKADQSKAFVPSVAAE